MSDLDHLVRAISWMPPDEQDDARAALGRLQGRLARAEAVIGAAQGLHIPFDPLPGSPNRKLLDALAVYVLAESRP